MGGLAKFFILLATFFFMSSIAFDAYSISISDRRLYLDPKSSITDIRILNMEAQNQNCEVLIKDVVINSQGQIALVTGNTKTENSAKPLVRLAPRRFTLGMKEHQMVKLLYRRKPGVKNGEFQGVLAIKCQQVTAKSDEKVKIDAALVHNVPIIVRTGKLPIKAEFISKVIQDDSLQVELEIKGQRSLTGTITLVDSDSGEVVHEQKNVSIYAQKPIKKLKFALGKHKNSPLLITFTENSKFGGKLVIQSQIK